MEWEFLEKLWSEDILKSFRDRIRRNTPITKRNRIYLNYPAGYYETRYKDILRGAEDKDCYIFGSGKYASYFIKRYGKDYPIVGYLDNDPERWGEKINGIEIFSPDILTKVDKDRIRIFICVKEYLDIVRQLDYMRIWDYSIFKLSEVYPRSTGITPTTDKPYHRGFCCGAFDMFHVGHLNLLRRAKELCDYLIVGVISDRRIFDIKERYPIIPCNERIQVVNGCRYVDQVVEISADRAGIIEMYDIYHYDCMFSGDDHVDDPLWLEERDELRKRGSDIVFLSYTDGISSSELREKMLSGNAIT